jgi:sensor c-di-GMP phosphodiesterase-like protein
VFQPELTEAADLQKSMESELRDAIVRNEFEVHYQPVIEARTGAVGAVEAFVRWDHPSKGMLHPDQFLSCALIAFAGGARRGTVARFRP